jgi:hypothetical protein
MFLSTWDEKKKRAAEMVGSACSATPNCHIMAQPPYQTTTVPRLDHRRGKEIDVGYYFDIIV